jgi:hypothetical protein
VALATALAWELFELSYVEPLIGFHEPLLNRWVADPLADWLGVVLGWSSATGRPPPP